MSQTATKTAPIERDAEPAAVSDDLLARIVTETERQVTAKANRPSPIRLRSWEEIERFAEKAARSGMVPKDFLGKPDAICIAVQMGSELGLAPMQSLQNIAVVNGRPAIWGDALPGLCRASGMCRSIREWSDGEGDALTFYCEAVRKDQALPIVAKFSVADAKRAKLWQENPTVRRKSRDGGTYEADSGPWYSYPDRMLQMRARGFALRDAFPDVLKGLLSAEEAGDIPWEDTGLSMAPPGAAAPPIRAAAAPTTRPDRITDKANVYETPAKPTNGNGQKRISPEDQEWLDSWQTSFDAAMTIAVVKDLEASAPYVNAIRKAPPFLVERLREIVFYAYQRLQPKISDPAAQASEEPSGEVAIEGEKYAAA